MINVWYLSENLLFCDQLFNDELESTEWSLLPGNPVEEVIDGVGLYPMTHLLDQHEWETQMKLELMGIPTDTAVLTHCIFTSSLVLVRLNGPDPRVIFLILPSRSKGPKPSSDIEKTTDRQGWWSTSVTHITSLIHT